MSRAGQQAVQWHMVMVYLTCAVIGLGGRGVIKTWTEVAARVRLYMLTSDLTSLVPPQFSHLAASEESWHRSVFFFFFYCEPCFQEVMEWHEKVDCNDSNETGKNRLNRDLPQEERENMVWDPGLSLSPYIKYRLG